MPSRPCKSDAASLFFAFDGDPPLPRRPLTMAADESQIAENMMVAGLDQDWSEAVRVWDTLTPLERGELALWMTGRKGDIREAPELILEQITGFASIAVLEAGLRWSRIQEGRDPITGETL